jgi:hypothetical protein
MLTDHELTSDSTSVTHTDAPSHEDDFLYSFAKLGVEGDEQGQVCQGPGSDYRHLRSVQVHIPASSHENLESNP